MNGSKVKNILAHKEILAWILKHTTVEFAEFSIMEIMECIEGEPEISIVKVNTGETNKKEKITGDNGADEVPNEGSIYYDIRFHVFVPNRGERIKILLNVEAQKNFYPGYEIVTRGIFYAGRMISAQLGTEFEIPDYDGLKKVYSIWICMNAPEYIGNAISQYSIVKGDIVSGIPDKKCAYDKISIIKICLNEEADSKNDFLKMMNTLLSSEKDAEEKKKELKNEFHIKMEYDFEKELNLMCNVAELVFEKAIKEGMEKGMETKLLEIVQKMSGRELTEDAIAEMLDEPVEKIRKMLENSK